MSLSVELISTAIASFLAGVGASHLYLMKKVNRHGEQLVAAEEKLKTLFEEVKGIKMAHDRDREHLTNAVQMTLKMHTETLTVVGKIVDQNSILIHQRIAERDSHAGG